MHRKLLVILALTLVGGCQERSIGPAIEPGIESLPLVKEDASCLRHRYPGTHFSLTMLATPNLLDISDTPGDTLWSRVSVRVHDEHLFPVPDLAVDLVCQRGLIDPAPLTNNAGMTEAWWYCLKTWLPDSNELWIGDPIGIAASAGGYDAECLIAVRR